jgi:hypothetical protein
MAIMVRIIGTITIQLQRGKSALILQRNKGTSKNSIYQMRQIRGRNVVFWLS